MKPYATVTSERASKGQGGNKYLTIDILGERLEGIPTRTNLFELVLSINDENELEANLLDYSNGDRIKIYPRHMSNPPKAKGEKRKTE